MSGRNDLSKKIVFKSKFFNVISQKIVLPNGLQRTYDVVERRPTVVVFPLTEKNEIYLISQYRYLFGKEIIEAVAGHIEEGEKSLATAKRELKEETGISALQWEELVRVESSASVIKSTVHLFLAKDLELKEASPDKSEDIELFKMTLDEAVKKVMTNEIISSSTMLGLMILDKLKKEKRI